MYPTTFTPSPRLVARLCVLCVLCVRISAQDFKTIHPGVEHAKVDHKIGNDPVKINLLRLDLRQVRLDVHHASDKAIGLERTSSIATRHRAVAAINAGFFRLDRSEFAGDAAGILKINGELLSESASDRIAMSIINGPGKTKIEFGHATTDAWVNISASLSSIAVDGINRGAKLNEAILFTKEFVNTPKSDVRILELVLSHCVPACRKAIVVESGGGTTVPRDGYVLALTGNKANLVTSELRRQIDEPSLSATVNNVVRVKGSRRGGFDKAEDIVAGVPQLVRNGKIEITGEREKAGKAFVEMRHPRTAVAKLKSGKFLMLTVDGRQPGVSVGMSLQELADYLLSIGATDAMNLDGGGSTTMFLDGKVINTPSDKEGERQVGDVILVTHRKKSRVHRR